MDDLAQTLEKMFLRFDTYASVIDYSTDQLIDRAFGNNWAMFHWDISVAFTNAKQKRRLMSNSLNLFLQIYFQVTKEELLQDETKPVRQQISTLGLV